MLRVRNTTPFVARLMPALDREGRDLAVVVVKGTFALEADRTPVADEQEPLVLADQHYSKPGASSVRYESDLCPGKPGTDVVWNGSAFAPGSGAEFVAVEMRAGTLLKRIAVLGDRRWLREAAGYRPSQPTRFAEMELVYERAFGGRDPAEDSATPGSYDARNPVGIGFVAAGTQRHHDGAPLPNLEDPAELMRAPTDRPTPAGCGFVHRSWAPRVALAGSYDQRWRDERAPFLPEDFDPRHHHAAAPGLASPTPFVGGEPFAASHVLPGGRTLGFDLPRVALEIVVRERGKDSVAHPVLDTVIVEPTRARLLLVWRAAHPCPRHLLHIERVTVRAARGS